MATRTAGRQGGTQMILTGNRELDRKLKWFTNQTQKKIVKDATKTAMKTIVLPDVKAHVPRDFGTLDEMLKVRATRGKRGKDQFGHAVVTAREGFYGAFLEFGTKQRKKRTGNKQPTGMIEAGVHDWMRIPLYDNEVRLRMYFINALRELIRLAGMAGRK